MKKLSVISIIIASVILSITTSCSVDNSIENEDVIVDSVYPITQGRNVDMVEVKLLIEWSDEISSKRKAEVRQGYKVKGVLNYFEICDNVKYETWYINCPDGLCSRASDTPVDTDDDVERFIINADCIELE